MWKYLLLLLLPISVYAYGLVEEPLHFNIYPSEYILSLENVSDISWTNYDFTGTLPEKTKAVYVCVYLQDTSSTENNPASFMLRPDDETYYTKEIYLANSNNSFTSLCTIVKLKNYKMEYSLNSCGTSTSTVYVQLLGYFK